MNADTFGTWLKTRRKRLDLTQEALANLVGCSVSAIRKIENDERRPSRQVAELLATHLEIPPEEQTLFLKIARGEGSSLGLKNASARPENWSALSESFSPLSNIPVSPSPFIGRRDEIETLTRMLTEPHYRLITILGVGGIGKTRLAMEVSHAQRALFDGHVYFIQLAAINTSDSILPAIASVLNIPTGGADELKPRLLEYLREKNTLLVLDNFEHIIDGAPLLSEFLQHAPKLKFLVTSRERLNLQGEWTLELSGLSVPPNADEGMAIYGALQLFESHARRICPDLKLIDKEREAAIRICQRVDGMPLAIELAAAWVNVLSCGEIADEIERGFDFLSSTLRDVPERHRSLRAVFEHSWKRLAKPEQVALSRLTIFQGGFSREAAESVVGAKRGVLSSLVSKSLLRRSSNRRFDLHEVIRQYAKDYLKDEAVLRDRHSEYYLTLLRQSETALFGGNESKRLRELFDEFGNLRIAWEHALKQKMYALMDQALDMYWTVYAVHGWFQDGIEQTSALLQALRGEAHTYEKKKYMGKALLACASFLGRSGKHVEARAMIEESIEILRSVEETKFLSQALIVYGKTVSMMGDFSLASALLDEGVQIAMRVNDLWSIALGHLNQGFNAAQEGNFEYAYEQMQAGLLIWRELGNMSGIAFALNNLTPIAIQLGKLDDADSYLQESLALSSQIHDRWSMGTIYGQMGVLAFQKGDLLSAKERLEKSLTIFNTLGLRWDIAATLIHLGKVAIASEDWIEAERLLKQAIKISLEVQVLPQAIDAALELAGCFIHRDEIEKAAELMLPAMGHSASTDSAKQRAEELKSKINLRLDFGDIKAEPMETVLARFSA
ncbi:MAG: tetratricopeptide repeat protein [Anaerolineales bacterium]|nr:tetratricopeptide repeat protein [Anaerolineales bacterium]